MIMKLQTTPGKMARKTTILVRKGPGQLERLQRLPRIMNGCRYAVLLIGRLFIVVLTLEIC